MAPKGHRRARELTSVKQLTPDPKNARRHGERNVGAIQDALQDVGAARSIVIDEKGVILAGNATVEAAGRAGITKLQVVEADGDTIVAVRRRGLTSQQKTRLALFDNRAAELAEGWDTDLLKDLQATGELDGLWTEDELATLFEAGPKAGKTDPDEIPAERPTGIVAGDLFELGPHRLLCGDCTKEKDVRRLIGAVKIDCLLIDPPYCSGGFQESSKASGSVGTSERKKLATRKVANDTLSTRGYQALLKSAIGNIDAALVYVFTDWRMWLNLFDVVESSGYGVRNMIVWDKGSPGMGSGWRTQHELIMFGTKVSPGFDNHKAQGNVIAAKRTGNEHHATQKPVDLLLKVLDVTDMAKTICDAFAGSGSTLLACEQAGRTFFGLELEPRHVQTTIDRWEAFTGLKATKVGEPVRIQKTARAS